MAAIIEMFPPEAIALNEEVRNHPLLLKLLSEHGPQTDLETTIGTIAAYCNVALDDYYMEEDLKALFNLLIHRLKKVGTVHLQ